MALEALPSLPVQYLVDLALKGDPILLDGSGVLSVLCVSADGVADFVAISLEHGNPEVRSAGIAALGNLLLQLDVIKGICQSSG